MKTETYRMKQRNLQDEAQQCFEGNKKDLKFVT